MKRLISTRMQTGAPVTKVSALVAFVAALAIYNTPLYAQQLENDGYEWARQMGGSGITYAFGNTLDDDGYLYTTGGLQTKATFGSFSLTSNGDYDIYITKTDSAGNFLWVTGMGGSGSDMGYSVATDDKGHVYMTGTFAGTVDFDGHQLISAGGSDGFVCQLNSTTGKVLWAKAIAGAAGDDEGNAIAVDAQGNIYVTGHFDGAANLGSMALTSSGGSDIFIAKMDQNGNFVWAKSAGGTGEDAGTSITTDQQGNVFVSGNFSGNASIGGTALSSAGGTDCFVSKLDASGNFKWTKGMGGNSTDETLGIGTDAQGNVYLSGTIDGGANNPVTFGQFTLNPFSYDFFTCKLDGNGNFVWVKNTNGVNTMRGGEALAVDANGTSYTTGWYTGTISIDNLSLTSAGQWDVFVCKRDKDGKAIWLVSMGGSKWEVGEGISVDAHDNVYVTGYFQDKADFDPGNAVQNLEAKGTYDGFILKLSSLCAAFKDKIVASSNEPVCVGDTLKLGAPSGSGYAYEWEGPDGFSSNLQNPTIPDVTYANSGYYVLTVTNSANCQDGHIMPVAINSYPVVAASANSPVCEGDTLNLFASGGGTFEWRGPNGYTSGVHYPQIANVTLADSGSYTVIVTSDGCSDSASVAVTVDPLPDAAFTVSAQGHTVTLTNETVNGDSYYWDYGDGTTSTNNANTHEHQYDFDNAHYNIMLVATNDCGSDTVTKAVDMATGIISQGTKAGITVFPNPFTDAIHLTLTLTKAAHADLSVNDVTGRQVYGFARKQLLQGDNDINLKSAFTNLPSGIYMIHVTLDSGESMMRKVVKVK